MRRGIRREMYPTVLFIKKLETRAPRSPKWFFIPLTAAFTSLL